MEQIQLGKADVVFCGAGEAEDWGFSVMFDAMGALPHSLTPTLTPTLTLPPTPTALPTH